MRRPRGHFRPGRILLDVPITSGGAHDDANIGPFDLAPPAWGVPPGRKPGGDDVTVAMSLTGTGGYDMVLAATPGNTFADVVLISAAAHVTQAAGVVQIGGRLPDGYRYLWVVQSSSDGFTASFTGKLTVEH